MMWSHSPSALTICNDRDKIALLQWNHHHQQQQQPQHATIHHDDGMDAVWMASDYQHADARDGPKKIHHIPSVLSAGGSTTRMLSGRTCTTRSNTFSSSRFDHVPLDVDKKMFPKSSASSRRGSRGDTNINTLCDCQSHPLPRSIHVVVSPFAGEEDEDDIHSQSACSSSRSSSSCWSKGSGWW